MVYCIYCGAKLPKPVPPRVPPPRPMAAPRPTAPTPTPPTVPPSAPTPPPTAPVGVKRDIVDLMNQISVYYDRKVKLLSLFNSGEVSERVFLKLYDEYSGRLNDLLNTRVRRMEDLRKQLEEKDRRLDEVALTLEELEVRHKVGEIDDQQFAQRTESLKAEKRRLGEEVKDLKMNIEHLEKLLADKSPKEILDMETKTRSFHESLDKFVQEGRLSSSSVNKIKEDINGMLSFFDLVIGERKERERKLREQLETLHARYRVSEISIEEYERKKREIQEEIKKLWS
ncbi:hypothetical protein DRO55_05380 [Candidatus Bathyarchaeota archaeon]|nr:MAG: hypothetical protein DRO55_05380 [Candidatus Bathyarchaeota archaeon]